MFIFQMKCIDICSEIIEEEFEQYAENDGEINLRKPKEIKEFFRSICY